MEIPQLQEQHNMYSGHFEKYARSIEMELVLCKNNSKTYSTLGEFVKIIKTEIDRLIDNGPFIPMSILEQHTKNITFDDDDDAEVVVNVDVVDVDANVDVEVGGNVGGNVKKIDTELIQNIHSFEKERWAMSQTRSPSVDISNESRILLKQMIMNKRVD
jgi:hypothetical protein